MSAQGGSRTLTPCGTRVWAVRGCHYTTRAEGDRPDSNRPPNLGEVRCLPLTLRSHGADDGLRARDPDDGNVVRYQLRHVRMEPARGIEPRPPPYQGGMLTVATKQARAGRPGLGPGNSRFKVERVCQFPYRPMRAPRIRADTRGRTGPSAVRNRSREPRASAWLPLVDSNHD
jgi:hypothetical protein